MFIKGYRKWLVGVLAMAALLFVPHIDPLTKKLLVLITIAFLGIQGAIDFTDKG